jgi:hypothetical protein
MLVSFRSSNLSWALIAALVAARREVDVARRTLGVATNRGLGKARLATGGNAAGLVMAVELEVDDGGWSGLGALPTPLGS